MEAEKKAGYTSSGLGARGNTALASWGLRPWAIRLRYALSAATLANSQFSYSVAVPSATFDARETKSEESEVKDEETSAADDGTMRSTQPELVTCISPETFSSD